MWQDPIVEEVRAARDAHAAQFNYDLRAIYRALKKEEAESGRNFVKLPPKGIEAKEETLEDSEARSARCNA
ncbi:MAG: hypothetical protein M3495_21630 [Pseudomonadota bacterium]|nr:hypothetical protein [Gammaproteobacteria bacterium]MDQ3584029.1 hypothetical protein [Pseudomonadota bacterium]